MKHFFLENRNFKLLFSLFCTAVCALMLSKCSGSGNSEKSLESFDLEVGEPLEGRFVNQAGGASGFNEWQVLLMKPSGETYRAQINELGGFVFYGVDISSFYTVALLDKDFRYTALLEPSAIGRSALSSYWFHFEGRVLPPLSLHGNQLSFTDHTDLVFGSTGENYSDHDNDGILAWFDDDDDNDGLVDAFDPDAFLAESGPGSAGQNDGKFLGVIESIVLQQIYEKDGPKTNLKLRALAKVERGSKVGKVRLVTRPSSLTNSQIISNFGEEELTSKGAFDGFLLDDGHNSDELAKDFLFGRKISLSNSELIKPRQVFFFEAEVGGAMLSYPYTQPAFTIGELDFSFSSNEISLSGDPFGNAVDGKKNQSFYWSFEVFDEKDGLVYASPSIPGDQKKSALPQNLLEAGKLYKARCYAKSLDRAWGLPQFIVQTEKKSM